jgi:diaminopropionate ammonia-lyase
MAGLNCGTLSSLAWPLLRDGFDAFVVIDNERAFEAMRLLSQDRVASGESGAAGAAGLIELACAVEGNLLHRELGLGSRSRVLVVSTEGITDPGIYRTVMGER